MTAKRSLKHAHKPLHPSDSGASSATPRRQIAVLIALALGVLLWGYSDQFHETSVRQWVFLAIAVAAGVIPAVRRRIEAALQRIRALSPRAVRWMAAGVFIAVSSYLLITATWQLRDLFPKWHDQQMTLVQTQMLARGHLWMPQHPCADFFETFYVLVKPIYASMYFPGAALFFVPIVWLHLPYWLMPLLASGAIAVLLFGIVTELIDPLAGLLAVVMLLSLLIYRLLSVWVMSHIVFTLLALAAVWCWLRWRRGHCMGLALALGACLGWAAITRPIDAIAYGLPIGIAVLWDLRVEPAMRRFRTISLIVIAAIPFLSLQLILDRGVTGSYFETPIHYYTRTELPGVSAFGGMPQAGAHDTSNLLQKQLLMNDFVLPLERQFASDSPAHRLGRRLQALLGATLPFSLLVLLLPVGVMALKYPRRLVVCAPVILFIAGYMFYPVLLPQYCIVVAPAIILATLLGAATVVRAWPRQRSALSTGLTVAILLLSLAALPEFNPQRPDDDSWPTTWFNYEELPREVTTPALVLYHYVPGKYASGMGNFYDEPVYNVDVAWPDNAPIIRAHDLGPDRDAQIIDYYARIQPQRNVYFISQADLKLHLIGKAGDIAKRLKQGGTLKAIMP
jgi:4-amino-4-deoxy-L-arabinose transferase-like glycosyltransferase